MCSSDLIVENPVGQEDHSTVSEDITTTDTTEGSLLADPKYAYLTKGDFWKKPKGWVTVGPMVAAPKEVQTISEQPEKISHELDDQDHETDAEKEAKRAWKAEHPETTVKAQRDKLARGEIDQLPWLGPVADNQQPTETTTGFGTMFPDSANKGDTFVRVDIMPNRVYKYNGNDWIAVDKNLSDNYTYDIAYIDHLIEKIASGEYDIELFRQEKKKTIDVIAEV